MLEIKVGIHLTSLRMPLLKGLAAAARLGAQGVELDARGELRPAELTQTALRQLRKTLNDFRLRVCAVSYRTRRGYGVLDDLDKRVAGTKEAMRMAQALGASVVVNHVGDVPAKAEGAEWDLLVQVLADLGRHGQQVGAMLAAQTGAVDGADLARLIAALPDGSIGVDLDPGALIVNGYSAQEAVEALGRHVMHVHASDGVRDLARGRGVEVPLGRGSVDWPALLATLEQRGYRGYFTIRRDGKRESGNGNWAGGEVLEKFLIGSIDARCGDENLTMAVLDGGDCGFDIRQNVVPADDPKASDREKPAVAQQMLNYADKGRTREEILGDDEWRDAEGAFHQRSDG